MLVSLPEKASDLRQVSGDRRATLLIVDDDEDNLVLMSYVVDSFGYAAVVARTGRDAIALAVEHCPDLILLDILLPDINGIAVLKQLRQHRRTKRIPIVAVTALARAADQARIAAAGFSDYLAKPYMLDDLDRLIRRHL